MTVSILPGVAGITKVAVAGGGALAVAALACVAAGIRAMAGPRETRFWLLAGVLLLLATVYRLAGAEHVLGDDMRAAAHEARWYGERRVPQALATIAAILVASGGAALLLTRLRRVAPVTRTAAFALVALVMLYAVRVVSLHLIDALLYARIGPLHVNWLIEAGLLATIVACALARIRNPSGRVRRPRLR